jgi:predicted RNase H-like nuclease (RuvC/YqgF family)
MDTSRIFDTLDRKIEKLLARLESLEGENDKLKADLAVARRAEKDTADSRGAVERLKADLAAARRAEKDAADSRDVVERLERDQEAVRERLEKLIGTLEAAEARKG